MQVGASGKPWERSMKIILLLLHVLVCVGLILIVLLQKGKGASMGAAFGGSSQTIFGSTGATSFLHKLTTAIAIIFMLTSLGLSFLLGKGTTTSVMEGVTQTAPITEQAESPPNGTETGD
jgi:preprotein translocase subunit SecG